MRPNDSQTDTFTPKVGPGSPEYKQRVAEPTMAAIDAMPLAYRLLVKEFDYVDVYRAWRRNISPDQIRARAAAQGGRFVL